jgi:cytochrome c peroxidase
MNKAAAWTAAVLIIAALILRLNPWPAGPVSWTDAETGILRSLALTSLPALPDDPTNAVADNPLAMEFGHQLFFDARLNGMGAISCSTCHQPIRRFTDGLEKGQALGTSKRNTPSIVGVAYSPWLYWDGRRDSLWAQALSPLEDPAEHGGDRHHYAAYIESNPVYREYYESLFGTVPDLSDTHNVDIVFANIGKAIAAYERLLLPGKSRFDDFVDAVVADDVVAQQSIFGDDEARGLKLFIGKANCTQCHNGPLFTNNEFHNTGVISYPGEVPDRGRIAGVREVQAQQFNCRSEFSDAEVKHCAELEFARSGYELMGAFRTPSLRNLENTAPYMHKGQIKTLGEVLQHYNEAPLAMIGHNEAKPLGLDSRELRQLEAFLRTLDAPLATAERWLRPPPPRLADQSGTE